MNTLQKKMLEAIQKHGALLVFPIKNKKLPKSLWSVLYPKSEMVWEWNENSDNRISKLWIDREYLSRTGEAVYTKWYQGRATFFSKKVFTLLLAYLESPKLEVNLLPSSKQALNELKEESPLSTKKIKVILEWQGKLMESHYNRAMKPLWERLYIVGFGEENDSSFPSLNMAASIYQFENEWSAVETYTSEQARIELTKLLGEGSIFLTYADKLKKKMHS
jgi:hypothetical protein